MNEIINACVGRDVVRGVPGSAISTVKKENTKTNLGTNLAVQSGMPMIAFMCTNYAGSAAYLTELELVKFLCVVVGWANYSVVVLLCCLCVVVLLLFCFCILQEALRRGECWQNEKDGFFNTSQHLLITFLQVFKT